MIETYPAPVDKLLALGRPQGYIDDVDYVALGIGPEHGPDLVRMATDESLHEGESGERAAYAPIHAWRALGQLRAEEAIEPLLGLLQRIDDEGDDWVGEDMPDVLARIGPAIIAPAASYVADAARGEFARVAAVRAIEETAKQHPDCRPACLAALTGQLEAFAVNGQIVNAYLISALVELDAVETAPSMERAFAAGVVDLAARGDWEDIQVELGLKSRRDTPRPNYAARSLGLPEDWLTKLQGSHWLRQAARLTEDPWRKEKRKQGKKRKKK